MNIQHHEQPPSSQRALDSLQIILPFAAIDRTFLSLVGGKAANLGELTRAGLPVPPGFCVSIHAYLQVMKDANLESLLAEFTKILSHNPARLGALAAAIRGRMLNVSMPVGLAEAIAGAY